MTSNPTCLTIRGDECDAGLAIRANIRSVSRNFRKDSNLKVDGQLRRILLFMQGYPIFIIMLDSTIT